MWSSPLIIMFLRSGKRILEVVQICPSERVQQRFDERMFDVPVPQVLEEVAEVGQVGPTGTRATDRRAGGGEFGAA